MQIYCWATVACLAVLLLALLASRGTLLHRFFFMMSPIPVWTFP